MNCKTMDSEKGVEVGNQCPDVSYCCGIFVGDGETSTTVSQNGLCLAEIRIRIKVISFTILDILLHDLLLHLHLLCCL
jgi:hypothetical protein